MYTKRVLDIFKKPSNAGRIIGADAVGEVGNVACGDIMKIYLKIEEDGMIKDAKFQTFGCAAAIASADTACKLIKGRNINASIKSTEVLNDLGELPSQKVHCSVLAEQAFEAAKKDYAKKQEKK